MTASGPSGGRDVAEHRHLTRQAQIHALRNAGASIGDMARQTGFGPRTIRKWLKISASGATRHGAKVLFTQLLPRLSVAPLGGRVRSRPGSASGDKARRLHRQLLPPGAARGEVAARWSRRSVTGSPSCQRRVRAGADDNGTMRRRRSRDRLDDHANRCGIAVYQAARFAYATSGSKGRLSEKCVVGIHSYASARHAIPRRSSESGHREIRRLAREPNNPEFTQCNVLPERCDETSTPSPTP